MRKFYKLRTFLLFFLLTVSWGMRGQESSNDGTKEKPYSIAEVIKLGNPKKNAWVKGYIIGCINNNKLEIGNFSIDSNIAMSDDPSSIDVYAPVQLPSGAIRTSLNLKNNPTHKGKQIIIYGSLDAYFSKPGIKSVSGYEFIQEMTKPIPVLKFQSSEKKVDILETGGIKNTLSITLDGVDSIPVSYTSLNTDIATVNSETGEVTIKKYGETTITATVTETETYQGASTSYILTVTAPTPKLTFESTSVTKDILEVPFTNPLTITFDRDEVLPVIYTSSDKSVATIDEFGEVTFLKAGSVTIEAAIKEANTYHGATASYKLTVTTPTPEMTFNATAVEMDIRENGFHNPLTVKLYDKENTELPVVYSSSNTGVATVGTDGTVSFVKFGTAKITATINQTNLYQKVFASYDLTITAPKPVLTFEQPTIRVVGVSETVTNPLTVVLEEKPFTEGVVTYKSSNTGVATVDSKTGIATPKGVGSTTITASMAAGTYYQASTTTYQLFVDKSPASLPFVFDGKVADIVGVMGLTSKGLDSNYGSAPYLRFDNTGDYMLLSFNESPGILSFDIKGYTFSGGVFSLEESTDGILFTEVEKYTTLESSKTTQVIEMLNKSSRYLRWIYTKKSTGNVALGGIRLERYIAVATPVISPDLDVFKESQEITLYCETENAVIYYTLDGSEPNNQSTRYTEPFTITATTNVKAVAYLENEKSETAEKFFECQNPIIYKVLFKESFDDLVFTGGNDDQWKGSVATVAIVEENYPGWTWGEKSYGANHCIRLGNSDNAGSVTTPELGVTGSAILAFRANIWEGVGDTDLEIVTTFPDWSGRVRVKDAASFHLYTLSLPELTPASRITIKCTNRFFMDDIMLLREVEGADVDGDIACIGFWEKDDINQLLTMNPQITSLDLAYLDLSILNSLNGLSNTNTLLFSRQSHAVNNEIIYGTAPALTLTDHKPFGTMTEFTATEAVYTRQAYQDGLWETIVLPYDVKELPADYEFVRFTGVAADKLSISFRTVEALEAHVPYLMRYVGTEKYDGQKECVFKAAQVAVTPQTKGDTFLGVYGRTKTEGKYILTFYEGSVVFGKGDATSFVTPFHAYLDIDVPQNAPLRIVHQPAGETGTDRIEAEGWSLSTGGAGELIVRSDKAVCLTVTAADGRIVRRVCVEAGETRIADLLPGVYVVNGKKGVVR